MKPVCDHVANVNSRSNRWRIVLSSEASDKTLEESFRSTSWAIRLRGTRSGGGVSLLGLHHRVTLSGVDQPRHEQGGPTATGAVLPNGTSSNQEPEYRPHTARDNEVLGPYGRDKTSSPFVSFG
jgi:hypothetical protein